jgi:hypothetical protein
MEVRFVSGDSHHGFVIRRFASRIRYQEIRITDSYQEIRITDSYQEIRITDRFSDAESSTVWTRL